MFRETVWKCVAAAVILFITLQILSSANHNHAHGNIASSRLFAKSQSKRSIQLDSNGAANLLSIDGVSNESNAWLAVVPEDLASSHIVILERRETGNSTFSVVPSSSSELPQTATSSSTSSSSEPVELSLTSMSLSFEQSPTSSSLSTSSTILPFTTSTSSTSEFFPSSTTSFFLPSSTTTTSSITTTFSSTSTSSSETPLTTSTSSTPSSISTPDATSEVESSSISVDAGTTYIINRTTTVIVNRPTSSLSLSMSSSSSSSSVSSSSGLSVKTRNIIIGVVVGVGVPLLSLLCFLVYFFFFRRSNKSFINSEGELVTKGSPDEEMIDGALFEESVVAGDDSPYRNRFSENDLDSESGPVTGGPTLPYRSGSVNHAVNF